MKTKSLRKQVRDDRRLARRKAANAGRLRDTAAGISAQQRAEITAQSRREWLEQVNMRADAERLEREQLESAGKGPIPSSPPRTVPGVSMQNFLLGAAVYAASQSTIRRR